MSTRQPRPWLAALLSANLPGLGDVYAGNVLRAFGWAAGILGVLAPIGSFAMLRSPRAVYAAAIPLALAIPITAAITAHRAARRPTSRFLSRGRIVAACLVYVVFFAVLDDVGRTLRERFIARPFRVPSGSMYPSLLIGDHLYIAPSAYRFADPRPGDVVVFTAAKEGRILAPLDRRPDLPTELFVKRIVGVPGDTIGFDGVVLSVNGETKTGLLTDETFTTDDGRALPTRTEVLGGRTYPVLDDPFRSAPPASYVVEPDRYFVAGDHRDASNDSRQWGTIDRRAIVGRASAIYWSWDVVTPLDEVLADPARLQKLLDGGIRWERIGIRP